MPGSKQLNIRVALIISLCLSLIDLAGNSDLLSSAGWFPWLPYLTMTVILVFACGEFRRRCQASATRGQVFRYGLRITLMISGIMIVYRLLFLYILFPETERTILSQFRRVMEKNGNTPQTVVDSLMGTMQKLFILFAMLGSFAVTMSCGLIASAIGAIVSKYRLIHIFSFTKSNHELCKQKP